MLLCSQSSPPFPAPGNPRSLLCPDRFAYARISYEWKHKICSLFSLVLLLNPMLLRFIHLVAPLYSWVVFNDTGVPQFTHSLIRSLLVLGDPVTRPGVYMCMGFHFSGIPKSGFLGRTMRDCWTLFQDDCCLPAACDISVASSHPH